MAMQEVTGNSGLQETQATNNTNKKNAPQGGNASTKITDGTMEGLKKASPEMYEQTLRTMAMTLCNEMKQSNERLKKLLREGRS